MIRVGSGVRFLVGLRAASSTVVRDPLHVTLVPRTQFEVPQKW